MYTPVLIIASLLIGQAEPAPSAELARQVRTLVRQLNSDQLVARQAAEKALIDLGPPALKLLPPIDKSTTPEMKERLERVQVTLYAAVVKAATQATRVTLKGEQMPLAEVFAAIERQTGNKIVHQGDAANVSVNLDAASYWQALDQVLDQAGLTLYHYGGQQGATETRARPAEGRPRHNSAAYQGIFRISGTEIEAVRNLRSPSVSALKLTMEIAWEPRLSLIALSQPLSEVKAVDENGNSIALDDTAGQQETTVLPNIAATEIIIPLALPDRSVKKIASLKGKLTAVVPGQVAKFEFENLAQAKNVERRKAGVSVILQSARKNGDVYEVSILVAFDKTAGALESHRGWVFRNPAYLLNAAGERVEQAAFEETRRTPHQIGLSYKFVLEKPLAEHKFVYETPAGIVRMPVEYELKNIELP